MFDKRGFSINDDFNLIGGILEKVAMHSKHKINIENLKYHRESHRYIENTDPLSIL